MKAGWLLVGKIIAIIKGGHFGLPCIDSIGLILSEMAQNVALCHCVVCCQKVDEINALQEKFKVRITVEKGQRINRIRIQGPPVEVTSALEQIHLIFQQVTRNDFEKFIAGQVTFFCSCSL